MGSAGLSGVRRARLGARQAGTLAPRRRHASGSDWPPATACAADRCQGIASRWRSAPARGADRTGGLTVASASRSLTNCWSDCKSDRSIGFACTDIPEHPGVEVFPTVEMIDRLYPPQGQSLKFPVPIDLTQDELLHGGRRQVRHARDLRRGSAARDSDCREDAERKLAGSKSHRAAIRS